jgi:glucokinase
VSSEKRVIGVDVGGTKVAAGLVDLHGEIIRRVRTPMVSTGDAAAGLAAVKSAIDALLNGESGLRDSIRGIGICSPGPLNPRTGIVVNPPNLPCWRNFPLADEVEKIYGVPVKVDNDANAAALAETKWGAGRGYLDVFYVTIGTGIGTGIIFNGEIYLGRTGAAGEGGHMTIDLRGPKCGCGKTGCIEILAAGPAIARRARTKLTAEPHRGAALLGPAHGKVEAVSSEMVGQAFSAGDPLAAEVLRETIALLAVWLGNIIDLLDPYVIIMGGGVSSMLKPLFSEIRAHLQACCVNSRSQEIPLLPARYGPDAGVAGGAALCAENAVQV